MGRRSKVVGPHSCKHPAVTTGRGRSGNIYTAEVSRPPRPNFLGNHLSSDQQQKANGMEITQRISLLYFMLFISIAFQIKLDGSWTRTSDLLVFDRDSESKNSFLASIVGLHWPYWSVSRTPSYHFCCSNRVSLAHLGTFEWPHCVRCQAEPSVVDETTDMAALCCSFHLSQPGQSENFQLCVVLKPSCGTDCLMELWMRW